MRDTTEKTSTRERILGIALDLFIEQGYDKVSLREIAERVGVTKAALYYHFASKDDIVRTLIAPVLGFAEPLAEFLQQRPTRKTWAQGWHVFLGWVLENRKLFALLQANRAKMEEFAQGMHDDERHLVMHERLEAIMTDTSIPLADRLRMGACMGVVGAALAMPEAALKGVPSHELLAMLQAIIDDILQIRRK